MFEKLIYDLLKYTLDGYEPEVAAILADADLLGSGIDRAVFALDEHLVVKIPRSRYETQSSLEQRNYELMLDYFAGDDDWRIPRMDFITVDNFTVVVAERVYGHLLAQTTNKAPINPWNACDAHTQNIIVDDNDTMWLVDLGYAHGYSDDGFFANVPWAV